MIRIMEVTMLEEKNHKKSTTADMLTGGIMVLGIGLLFLLINLGVLPDLGRTWPLFLIIVGGALIVGATMKKRK